MGKQKFEEKITELRKRRGLSQKEVADYLGITIAAYGHYEAGRREAGYDTVVKLADFYHVSLDYLFGRGADCSSSLDRLTEEENLDSMERTILEQYFTLTPEQRAAFVDFMKKTVESERQKQELEYDEYTLGELEDGKEKDEKLGADKIKKLPKSSGKRKL